MARATNKAKSNSQTQEHDTDSKTNSDIPDNRRRLRSGKLLPSSDSDGFTENVVPTISPEQSKEDTPEASLENSDMRRELAKKEYYKRFISKKLPPKKSPQFVKKDPVLRGRTILTPFELLRKESNKKISQEGTAPTADQENVVQAVETTEVVQPKVEKKRRRRRIKRTPPKPKYKPGCPAIRRC